MRDVTLVYLVRDDTISFAAKKRGFGAGKLNGYGGKPESYDKSIIDTALRELGQESRGVRGHPEDLEKVAEIEFYFRDIAKEKGWDQRVHVYFLRKWTGEPQETEEMAAPEVYPLGKPLPVERMWAADRYWLPRVVTGEKLKGSVTFGGKGESVVGYEFDSVDSFR